MTTEGDAVWEFGPFRLDQAERQLYRDGELVPLTGKAFEVLALLVRNSGRTVTREEFMTEVWAGTVVEEANLTDNISTLRQALNDDPRDPAYIRTVPRRGYQFVGEVRSANRSPVATGRDRSRPASVQRNAIIVAAILVLAAAAGIIAYVRDPLETVAPHPPLRSIAVFPFQALGTAASETHLGISLADSLITHLTNVEDLIVRPVSAVLPYATEGRDFLAAAREQRVDALVEGRIRKSGNRIRVTVQLVNVSEARTLWARTFDEDESSLFAVEDRIVRQIAEALSVRLRKSAVVHVPDPEAYELYGAGRYFWSQRTPASVEKSIDLFLQAITIDPEFALAHAGLADAYNAAAIWNFRPPRESFPRARQAALAALALDSDLAEARTSLACVKFRYDWKSDEAEAEFRRAIAAKPNYATVRTLFAEFLVARGRYAEAAAELEKARSLDPRSPYVAMIGAIRSYFMRDYAVAASQLNALLQRHPDFVLAQDLLWAVYRETGDEERSVAARLAAFRSMFEEEAPVERLREAYRSAGIRAYRHAENAYLLEQARTQYMPAVFLAMNHAQNGDANLAFEWLEKTFQERSGWLLELNVDPVWDPIRNDERFALLVRKVEGRSSDR